MARHSRRETSAMPAGPAATAVSSGLCRGRDGARSCRRVYGGVLTLVFLPLGPPCSSSDKGCLAGQQRPATPHPRRSRCLGLSLRHHYSGQLIQQRLCVLQILGVETFSEPVVDRGQQLIGVLAFTLALPQPC